jgi:hypothetical protein
MVFTLLSNPDSGLSRSFFEEETFFMLLRKDAQDACQVEGRVRLKVGSGERGSTRGGRL